MLVTKRNGTLEPIKFDKIQTRIKNAGKESNLSLDPIHFSSLAMKVIDQLYDKIPTTKIDELTGDQCASLTTQHPDYGILAARVIVSNHHKATTPSFYKAMYTLYHFQDIHGVSVPLISKETWDIISRYRKSLETMIDYNRDFLIDYFGFKTLERAYLMKANGQIVERPQHMWLRVSVGIHGDNMDAVKETYDLMSQKYFIHATPTLFNAGTPRPQLSSCYLIAMESDSLEGIFDTLKDCAQISKWSGGIGLHVHNVRANNSFIRGTNGKSSGLVPMLKVFNDTARFINQGGKRNGSFAVYLEPWHADVEDFLELKKNHGDEEKKARDLFYALWVPDLFMERVKANGSWSLFCPNECPGLSDVYGPAFVALYERYESEGRSRRTMLARDLWFKILDAQMETGTPYLLFKDAANTKSNQKNLGMIKSSNLCVAPETRILTDRGYQVISELEGQQVNVWNGQEFSEVTIFKTGTNQELMEVETSDGCKLVCTPYHKFFVETYHPYDGQMVETKEAQTLQIGDKLLDWSPPIGMSIQGAKNVHIAKVTRLERRDDTYCFTEPKRHAGVFGGVLTSQCTEIMEVSDNKETAVCNLASLSLPAFVDEATQSFDFEKLHQVTQVVTANLNRVIDINFYPTEKTRVSNMAHRPIGIGVQGLADAFILLNMAFGSDEAKELNKAIFETIYHAALTKSNELAKRDGAYSTFREGPLGPSPAAQGLLQFDLWSIDPGTKRYDWPTLKSSIVEHGLRNSLLLAPMPTASTSQILGNNECFEPLTSNIYSRSTLAGEFVLANKYLMRDLLALGLWNEKVKNNIIANQGSIQQLTMIPEEIRNKYKIVWEIPMKHLIDMSADRGAFVCQSQSLNLWQEDPTYGTLTSMHFYSWKRGLKTGIYYLRRKAKHQAQQFTLEPEQNTGTGGSISLGVEEDEICEMCSS